MAIENGNDPDFEEHLMRFHAWKTPVVLAGLKSMVEKGTAPSEVLEDPTGVEYHKWQHRGKDGNGGSPLHTHRSRNKNS